MNTNPHTESDPKIINHSVSHFPENDPVGLTPTEAQSLIKHAPDERSRLWFRLLHDTGLRRGQLLDLRKWDLRDHEGIDHVVVRLEGRFDNRLCRAPIRPSTAKAFRRYVKRNWTRDLLFPGNGLTLAIELEMCLHLAAHGARIRKRFDSGIFRRMKVRAFQEAGVGPYVVISTIGWTREFGVVGRGCMGPLRALEEAARVLGEEEYSKGLQALYVEKPDP